MAPESNLEGTARTLPFDSLPVIEYRITRVALPGTLSLSNGATITTSHDLLARLTNTTLRSSQQAVLNHHGYGYNAASQRTSVTNLKGSVPEFRKVGRDGAGLRR